MGLLSAMTTLAEQWDEVLGSLGPGEASSLRQLVAQFANEADPRASAKIAERIMDLLVDVLPVTSPVLRALADPESRSWRGTGQPTDRAWARLAESLRARARPPGPSFGDDGDGQPGTPMGGDGGPTNGTTLGDDGD
jgi:hypothetical protein